MGSHLRAWRRQYAIPPDASPATGTGIASGPRPIAVRADPPVPLAHYQTTARASPRPVCPLFSGIHRITGLAGPRASDHRRAALREGAARPDVMLSLFDYPKPSSTRPSPGLRVNFAAGAGDSAGFRFVGIEGVLTSTPGPPGEDPAPAEPLHIDTFPNSAHEQFRRGTVPGTRPRPQLQPCSGGSPCPRNYNDTEQHSDLLRLHPPAPRWWRTPCSASARRARPWCAT